MFHGEVRDDLMHRVECFIARFLGMRLVRLHPETGDLLLHWLPHVPEESPVSRGAHLMAVARAVHVVHGLHVGLTRPGHAGLVEAGEGIGRVGEHGVVRGGGRAVVEAQLAPHLSPEEEVPGVGRVVVRLGVGQVAVGLLPAVAGLRQLQARHVARLHEGIHRGHPGTGGYWAGRGDISTHHHLSHHSSPLPPLRPPETSRGQLVHSLQFSLSQLRFVLVRPAFFGAETGARPDQRAVC